MRALVAFASKYGATTEIAQAIARTLTEDGLDVDLRPAEDIRSVDDYRVVVVGSAVYMGRWRRPATRLLRRHRKALAERDLWLFSSGPIGETDLDDPKAQRWIRPRKVQELAEALGAHHHAVFGGKVDEDGGPMRRKMAEETPEDQRDTRDWDEIEAWAHDVASTATHGVRCLDRGSTITPGGATAS